jgi:archaetidylinositol phosphate synthase
MIYASVGSQKGNEEPSIPPAIRDGNSDAWRIQNGLLSELERKGLLRLVKRIPPWVNSDHLTVVGFLAMIFASISYGLSASNSNFLWLASFFILMNWLGDSLDGTLARYRNRLRPRYGFYVDHILDTFSTSFLICGLALSGYLTPSIAALFLIVYLMLSIQVYLATYSTGKFKLSYGWFSPTELRVLLIIGNWAVISRPEVIVSNNRILLFDLGGVIGIVIMAFILVQSTVKNIVYLYNKDKLTS